MNKRDEIEKALNLISMAGEILSGLAGFMDAEKDFYNIARGQFRVIEGRKTHGKINSVDAGDRGVRSNIGQSPTRD